MGSRSIAARRFRRMAFACAVMAIFTTAAAGSTERPDSRIVLNNGDVLTGEVLSQSETEVKFLHPTLGEMTLPASAVKSIGPAVEAQNADEIEAQPEEEKPAAPNPVAPITVEKLNDAEAAAEEPKPGLFGSPILRGYDKSFNVGLTGTDGNTETLSLVTKFQADSETPELRTSLQASYFFSRNGDGRTRNEGDILANRDWKMPGSDWFAFGRVQYQYDEFQPWEQRLGVFGGPGYTFYDDDKFRLLGRVGVGATNDFGEVNELHPEGLLGIEGFWKVAENQKFIFRNTTFPLLDDIGEYRNLTELSYVIDLDRGDGLQVKFGIENEYESNTEGDAKHNDVKYFAAIGFQF